MLVLHPSSRCDVCLDPYNWDSQAQSPHAIPCGHIFCKTCLEAVTPSSCPLCRKAFLPDRIKKLHVDKPENVDSNQVEETRETDLLRSLCLLLGENTPEDDVEALTEEVGTYLENKADDTCIPLRKAKDGLINYHKLKRKREKDRAALSKMTKLLSTALERADEDSKLSKSIEESLLLKIDHLTSQHSECEIVIEKLRTDLAKYQHSSNPLPKPPEPIPLDRFPAFARAAAAGYRSASDPHVPPSPKPSANGTSTDLISNAASTSTRTSDEYVSPDPTTRAQIAARDRESAEKLEAEEAHRRDGIVQRKQKQPLYNVYRYPNHADLNGKRSDVIPGASPNQRVIPGTSSRMSQDMSNWREPNSSSASDLTNPAPASAYVDGYAHGYGYGYSYAPVMRVTMSHDGTVSAPSGPSPARDETPRVGLGLYGVSSTSAAETSQRSVQPDAYSILQPPQATSTDPATSSSSSSRPHGHHRSSRTRRDSVTADGHATDSTLILSTSSSGAHRSRRRSSRAAQPLQTLPPQPEAPAAPTPGSVTSTDRVSISSWGTVDSRQAPGSSGSSVAGLRLQWFPLGTGARTSVSSDTPRDPLYPFNTRQNESGTESTRSGATRTASMDATPRASDHSIPAVSDPLHTLSMLLETNTSLGSRHARVVMEDRPRPSRHSTLVDSTTRSSTSNSNTTITAQDSATSSRDPTRRRHRHRRTSTSAATRPHLDIPAPSAVPSTSAPNITSGGIVDEGYLSDAQPAMPQSFGNALGLDLTEEPQSAGLVISAPTPIVSTRNFLRSWSYDQ